jgi:D-alanyl-D-alanine carboxypeptidase (penicillin-binding protein 5/6)
MRPRIPVKKQRRIRIRRLFIPLLITYVLYATLRPIALPLTLNITLPQQPSSSSPSIPWPSEGQAAYGAVGYGVLATHNIDAPTPTASVAKVITALSILDKKPLQLGATGPTITFNSADVDIYNHYYLNDGSSVPVTSGEHMTEYQALQAMMIPSANNIADSLAIWAFGSLDAYKTYASGYVARHGMTHTTVDDASGFSDHTVSTADDLILLGQAALQNPALAQIVGQKSASSPSGSFSNVNTLLGQSSIVGIKTGNTDAAGGVFLGAATITVQNKPLIIITAVMHTSSLSTALSYSLPLIQASDKLFSLTNVVSSGTIVGTATTAWGTSTNLAVQQSIDLVNWNQTPPSVSSTTQKTLSSVASKTVVGKMIAKDHDFTTTSDIVLENRPSQPGLLWRLLHPLS